MQQSGFLSKLYDIKPFKIVQSPQTTKKYQTTLPTHTNQFSTYININPIPTLQQNKISSSQNSYTTPNLNPNINPILYPLKTQSCNIALNSTPTKIQSHPFIDYQLSSSKKLRKIYSNNQPTSPLQLIHNKKQQKYVPVQQIILPSPVKILNKQNSLPVGTMIQSQLYTNLSSSIDTLFSKIQKIKQEFECPLSDKKINREVSDICAGGKQKSSNRKNQRYMSKNNSQNRSQITGYSPILQANKDISSLSSFSPLLNKPTNNQIPQQKQRNSYNNKQLLNQIYKQKPYQTQSSHSIQPFILPATHTNITQINNKTRTIIDQINILMDSNKKNNHNKQQMPKNPRIKKYHRINTNYTYGGDNYQQKQKQKYREKQQVHMVMNTMEDRKQYDQFQFDDQFMMIKLKSTQSQYVPKLGYQNSQIQGKNRSRAGSRYQRQYANIQYKIDIPLYKQASPLTKNNQRSSKKIRSQNKQIPITVPAQNISQNLSMRQFQLGKCIGSGKFGDVHICKHKSTGFIFALKKIFKSTIKQYNMIPQFTLQLKIHYSLSNNHPNITKLYTHFQDEYHVFLLMQYIEDGTLMNHLKQTEQFVSQIIFQVLNSIQYLHRNNIAHRDLKPQNILLTNGVAKLCDFGWSSKFKNQMRSTFCGTLDYVSPEMKDKGEYNTSVDLWSIGVLTFQLLVGFPPHKKQIDKWKVMGANIKDKWRWDVIFPPQISQSAQNFIKQLLKQNPDERISIRQCRQQQFITKYNKKQKQNQNYSKQINKILNN